MNKILVITTVAAIAVLLGGCATGDTESTEANGANTALHPATGYKYPLEQPNADEQVGLLLRFSFAKALQYHIETLGDSATGKRKGGEFDFVKEITYLPTESADIFIVKSDKFVQKWNSRGGLIESTPIETARSILKSIDDNGFLPQSSVKIGDVWKQHAISESTNSSIRLDSTLDQKRDWTFVGVATVRTHRCAVLQASESFKQISNDPTGSQDLERTARLINYFDYRAGELVESASLSNFHKTITLSKSGRVIEKSGHGQVLLTLEE